MARKPVYTIPYKWNKEVWIVTSALFVGLIGTILFLIYGFVKGLDRGMLYSLIPLVVTLLGLIIGCEGYAPQCLEVGDDRIVVVRRYASVTIHRAEIVSMRKLSEKDFRGVLRLCGDGGLFGYTGKYWSKRLGSFSLYATSRSNLFLIKTATRGQIVLGCSEPEKILEFWQE